MAKANSSRRRPITIEHAPRKQRINLSLDLDSIEYLKWIGRNNISLAVRTIVRKIKSGDLIEK